MFYLGYDMPAAVELQRVNILMREHARYTVA
jgi:hypothetical protein